MHSRKYAAVAAMISRLTVLLLAAAVPGFSSWSRADEGDSADVEFFEAKIRPVLVQRCYECHSAGAKELKGGLRVDLREGMRKGGESGPAVVPGEPGEGTLLEALRHESFEMPPDGKLSADVIADFETWIARGAVDPREGGLATSGPAPIDIEAAKSFWSLRPLARPPLPPGADSSWPAAAIDRFVLARLNQHDLAPGADADRRTLIRRLYFDLVGLPPSPRELEEFLSDESPLAVERVVDRLLASPRFGERWGRHWLDVARFAESSGGGRTLIFHDAWRYRDYVLGAMNDDKPFDRFITEQIAGDLMPHEARDERGEQLTALGFLMLGPHNYELQDKELLRMEVIDEQIDTVGRAFLGMTIGCARCHDHKFDPIPTADYYALAGIFRSTKSLVPGNVSGYETRTLPVDPRREAEINAHAKRVASAEQQIKLVEAELASVQQQLDPEAGPLDLANLPGVVVDDAQAEKTGDWKSSTYTKGYVGAAYLHDDDAGKGDKSVSFSADLPAAGEYEVRISYTTGGSRSQRVKVTIFHAGDETTKRVDQRADPPIGGSFLSLGTFRFAADAPARVVISNEDAPGHVIADAVQWLPAGEIGAAAPQKDDPKETARLADLREQAKSLEQQQGKLKGELAAIKKAAAPPAPVVMAVKEEAEVGDYKICIRGSPRNLGPVAPRGFLSAAGGGAAEISPGQSGRLELARWIASAENPLTARVIVNRVWRQLFGAGLVRTPDNFGRMGERPSHPELLDWLATDFAADGWSIKRLVRQIVMSRTYQLSSEPHSAAAAVDPENRLLARQNRRRLDAEAIHDAMLAASGELDLAYGGPTMAPSVSSEFGFDFSGRRRRGVYVPVLRNTLHPLFAVFDFADPNLVMGSRGTSTLATQALFLMNSPMAIEQSQRLAEDLLAQNGLDDAARVDRAYLLTLGRPPESIEREMALEYLSGTEDGNARRTRWTAFCQTLLACLDFRYLD